VVRNSMLWFLRIFVGGILLATGIGKLLDVPGFMGVIATYRVLPEASYAFIAVFMVVLELRLAEWIFRGRGVGNFGLRAAGLVSAGLHICFTFWAVLALVRGLDIPNCGCFGVFWARPLTWTTVIEDLVMVAASFGIWRLARE
jgi:uncharacterized membrane protein YphA (DoxX/SURF4 family)